MLVGRHGCRKIQHAVETHYDQLLWGNVPGGWTRGLVIAELLAREVQRQGALPGLMRVEGPLPGGWPTIYGAERHRAPLGSQLVESLADSSVVWRRPMAAPLGPPLDQFHRSEHERLDEWLGYS